MKESNLYLTLALTLGLLFTPIEPRIHRRHPRPRHLEGEEDPMENSAEDEAIFNIRPHLEEHPEFDENNLNHLTPMINEAEGGMNPVPMNFVSPQVEKDLAKFKHT